jgi:F-type H+-transporting ATPase subunit gamma
MHAQNVLISRPTTARLTRAQSLPGTLSEIPADQAIASIIDTYNKLCIHAQLTLVHAQAQYSEHAARAIAMQTAHTNAQENLHKLAVAYHKARQAQITNDIIELSSGLSAQE